MFCTDSDLAVVARLSTLNFKATQGELHKRLLACEEQDALNDAIMREIEEWEAHRSHYDYWMNMARRLAEGIAGTGTDGH